MMVNPIRRFLPAVALILAFQGAAASTWTFGSGGNTYVSSGASYGNRVTYSQGSETLRVTAWSDTGNGPDAEFQSAYLRPFSTGLGVCNRDERSITKCIKSGVGHQVDNVGQEDLVLFLFDSAQALQSLTIDPYGVWDRDVSFWVGTAPLGVSLSNSTFGTLVALGFSAQVNSYNSAGEAPLTLSLGGLVGNALLVGGLYPADGSADRFKIRSLVTTPAATLVPAPGAFVLLLSAIGSLAGVRRRN